MESFILNLVKTYQDVFEFFNKMRKTMHPEYELHKALPIANTIGSIVIGIMKQDTNMYYDVFILNNTHSDTYYKILYPDTDLLLSIISRMKSILANEGINIDDYEHNVEGFLVKRLKSDMNIDDCYYYKVNEAKLLFLADKLRPDYEIYEKIRPTDIKNVDYNVLAIEAGASIGDILFLGTPDDGGFYIKQADSVLHTSYDAIIKIATDLYPYKNYQKACDILEHFLKRYTYKDASHINQLLKERDDLLSLLYDYGIITLNESEYDLMEHSTRLTTDMKDVLIYAGGWTVKKYIEGEEDNDGAVIVDKQFSVRLKVMLSKMRLEVEKYKKKVKRDLVKQNKRERNYDKNKTDRPHPNDISFLLRKRPNTTHPRVLFLADKVNKDYRTERYLHPEQTNDLYTIAIDAKASDGDIVFFGSSYESRQFNGFYFINNGIECMEGYFGDGNGEFKEYAESEYPDKDYTNAIKLVNTFLTDWLKCDFIEL